MCSRIATQIEWATYTCPGKHSKQHEHNTTGYEYNFRKYTNTANMEITLAYSPEVNTAMSDRIKVAEYNAIYINFQKLVKAINKLK